MIKVGAYFHNTFTSFIVWAPMKKKVELIIQNQHHKLSPLKNGYWQKNIKNVLPNTLYAYRLDDSPPLPDPASFCQPFGTNGLSALLDPFFPWEDQLFQNIPKERMILYELHIGCFTQEGTFDAALLHLDELLDLGINTIEIMPISTFSGTRNWGYDGVFPFAPFYLYGGPQKFKHFVNECHKKNISVILDVVYNHLGPEGNIFEHYGPYFTNKYQTFWGKAVAFDEPYSQPIRNFFIQNALYFLEEFHLDGLRLDAVHAIFDSSKIHFLKELQIHISLLEKKLHKKYHIIAESDLNNSQIILPQKKDGYGISMQWSDDFHHAIHSFLTEEKRGYYKDYGKIEDIITSLKWGYSYIGQYSIYRQKYHGTIPLGTIPSQFIFFLQNHDQVGNRMKGERLHHLIPFKSYQAILPLFLLAPQIPMLFMGEEFLTETPFLYFIDHQNPTLIQAVREGRKKEFQEFYHPNEFIDPKNASSFENSKLKRTLNSEQKKAYQIYKDLLHLRKNHPAFSKDKHKVILLAKNIILLKRESLNGIAFIICNISSEDFTIPQKLINEIQSIKYTNIKTYPHFKQFPQKIEKKSFLIILKKI